MKMNKRKVVVILAAILILIFGAACVCGIVENKNQYTTMAYCEYLENEILKFSFKGESFQSTLERWQDFNEKLCARSQKQQRNAQILER